MDAVKLSANQVLEANLVHYFYIKCLKKRLQHYVYSALKYWTFVLLSNESSTLFPIMSCSLYFYETNEELVFSQRHLMKWVPDRIYLSLYKNLVLFLSSRAVSALARIVMV